MKSEGQYRSLASRYPYTLKTLALYGYIMVTVGLLVLFLRRELVDYNILPPSVALLSGISSFSFGSAFLLLHYLTTGSFSMNARSQAVGPTRDLAKTQRDIYAVLQQFPSANQISRNLDEIKSLVRDSQKVTAGFTDEERVIPPQN